MRISRFLLASVVSVAATLPAAALAQTTISCDATGSPSPTCSKNKAATATVSQVLSLMIKRDTIDLQANDSTAYEKTFRAWGNAAGTPGSPVTTATTLQDAGGTDSVVAFGNRPFKATLQAADDLFQFEKDGTYNTCRASANDPDGVANTTCAGTASPTGKSSHDVYVQINPVTFASSGATLTSGTFVSLPTPTDAAPLTIADRSTGGRVAAQIKLKSAWYYATDIPGAYTATLVYTITGQ